MQKKNAAKITFFPGIMVNGVTKVRGNYISFLVNNGFCHLDNKVEPYEKRAIELGLKMSGYAVRVQI